MTASQPVAGGGVGDGHPEEGDAEDDEDEIKHERGPSGPERPRLRLSLETA